MAGLGVVDPAISPYVPGVDSSGGDSLKKSEIFNIVTHVVGAIATPIGIAILVVPALRDGDLVRAVGFTVYGLGLLASYTASVLFHAFRGETRETFRRYDRMAIYVLIAATYTPFTLLSIPPDWGEPFLALVWLLALFGIWQERRAAHLPASRPVNVGLYLLMGWLSVLAFEPLMRTLTLRGFALFLFGGIVYTVGALVVRYRLVPLSHEVWHVMVLLASACHFAVLYLYLT